MDIPTLLGSLQAISLDTETTLENQIDLVKNISTQIDVFNTANESKFHFTNQPENRISQILLSYLKRALGYLNRVEKFEFPEEYRLTDAYYSLAYHCLNLIRILSRDTNVIISLQINELLDHIQLAADLKDIELNLEPSKTDSAESNFNVKDSLTLAEAEIVLKTRERNELILVALKAISNLIYNSKYVQTFYPQNNLHKDIGVFLLNLLNNSTTGPIYKTAAECDIILFRLKILFLLTVFNRDIRVHLCEEFEMLKTFTKLISKFNLRQEPDCCLAIEVLKIAYNLTMDIESVRIQAKNALSSIKLPEEGFLNSAECTKVEIENNEILKSYGNVLRSLLVPKNKSDQVCSIKHTELISNSINLLTNLPSNCFEAIIPATSGSTEPNSVIFETRNVTAISAILEYLSENLQLYINLKIPVDTLYPVLMLCAVMSKCNKIIRHYLRLQILPQLTKKDLVNLPQNGTTTRNFLVKLMTDPNLQLKRLCAQFLFILCKESVGKLIKYTGYGNAAGLLAEAGLMLASGGDTNAYSESDDSDSEDYKLLEKDINVITGQAEVDDEDSEGLLNANEVQAKVKKQQRRDIFEGMTEEQKEYEALQLVNAIDKLTRMGNGLIKPATVGPDGKPVEMEHVMQMLEKNEVNKK